MSIEGMQDEIIDALKRANNQLAGIIKIVQATEPERLSAALVSELTELLGDATEEADAMLRSLRTAVERSPRQMRVDSALSHVDQRTGEMTEMGAGRGV